MSAEASFEQEDRSQGVTWEALIFLAAITLSISWTDIESDLTSAPFVRSVVTFTLDVSGIEKLKSPKLMVLVAILTSTRAA